MKINKAVSCKFIRLVLACMTISMVLAGCQQAGKEDPSISDDNSMAESKGGDLSDIIPKETITLTVYSKTANYAGEQIGWFGQVMKEKFNVKFNVVPDPDGTTYTTRMEAGNMGDIVIWENDDKDKYLAAIAKDLLMD